MDEPEMMENSAAVPEADREREVKRLRERLRETERQRRSVAFFAAIVLPFVLLAVLICFANSRNMAYTPAFDYVLSAAVGLVLGLLFISLPFYTNIYLKGDTERRGFFVSGKEDAAGNTVCIPKAADAA